ncbi:hypothetical protein CDAR_248211 [Caerostris darwini]|uniref:Uncharacterized protein n=1 Tax=Caerostris darwini TaxID=1538125 RepID=A0AAV4VKS5_9ARAC|nr:hypothetical protein CDAR_248211 [Caerostris darwini]
MTDVCRKEFSGPLPGDLKSHKETKPDDENQIMKELREKMLKTKYRLLDYQNQNQLLRKELMMADRVLKKELPNYEQMLHHGTVHGKEGRDRLPSEHDCCPSEEDRRSGRG